jgi:hypothetical protein
MITLNELVKGRDKLAPAEYTKAVQANLSVLLEKLNIIRAKYGKPMNISSGWRTSAINDSTSNAAKKSKHLSGLAADVQDLDGKFWEWCLSNLALMQELGLYLEDRRYTPTWVHLGIGAPPSGKRIFIPSTKPATAPHLFNGKYDAKFDKI